MSFANTILSLFRQYKIQNHYLMKNPQSLNFLSLTYQHRKTTLIIENHSRTS